MPAVTSAAAQPEEFHDDVIYPAAGVFILFHLACLLALWTGITLEAVLLGTALYWIRMFGLTGGYHRYFSHRSYRTSRVGQFALAALSQSGMQRGVLWWSAIHRHHHRHSDTELDFHSPRHRGFFYAHVGWIFTKRADTADYSTVADLAAYPEIRWLDRHPYFLAILLGVACFLIAGWPGLSVGFFWSTVALFHGSVAINSLAHVHGKQRYVTGDDSRNNWWLALITMGEGWHNNHHAYQSSTRQGFRWYEIDPTYYVLKVLSWFRVVWDLRAPPPEVVANEQRLGRKVVEQVALQLAATFPVERMAAQLREAWQQAPAMEDLRRELREAWDQAPGLDDLRRELRGAWDHAPGLDELRRGLSTRADDAMARAVEARAYLAARLAAVQLPHVPTLEELRQFVERTFEQVPPVSVNDVAERTRQILIEKVSGKLLEGPEPLPA